MGCSWQNSKDGPPRFLSPGDSSNTALGTARKGFCTSESSPKSTDFKIKRFSGWAGPNHGSLLEVESFPLLVEKTVDRGRFDIPSLT